MGSLWSRRATDARRRADHVNGWQLHDARQERSVRRPCHDGRRVLTVGEPAQLYLGHPTRLVEMPGDILLLPAGLDELENDGSSGTGLATSERHEQPRRLGPDKAGPGHRARARDQFAAATGIGEVHPLDVELRAYPRGWSVCGAGLRGASLRSAGLRREGDLRWSGHVRRGWHGDALDHPAAGIVARPLRPFRSLLRRGIGFDFVL